MQTDRNQPPTSLKDFLVLKMVGLYRWSHPAESLGYRLLLSGNSAYVYNQRTITVIKPQEDPDTLEFHGTQETLLGTCNFSFYHTTFFCT